MTVFDESQYRKGVINNVFKLFLGKKMKRELKFSELSIKDLGQATKSIG